MRRKDEERNADVQDASRLRVGIAVSRYNADITSGLLEGARATMRQWGVREKNTFVIETYGSFELPLACSRLIKRHRVHALVALGCVVKGETKHDEHIATAVMGALQSVMLESGVPIGLGVLTVNTLAQARGRSRGEGNHGAKAAAAALDLALS